MRAITRDPDGQPGTWRPLGIDGRQSATVFCPGCGRRGSLGDHEIGPDGNVNPSLVCPKDCGFHDYVTLVGWEHTAKPVER